MPRLRRASAVLHLVSLNGRLIPRRPSDGHLTGPSGPTGLRAHGNALDAGGFLARAVDSIRFRGVVLRLVLRALNGGAVTGHRPAPLDGRLRYRAERHLGFVSEPASYRGITRRTLQGQQEFRRWARAEVVRGPSSGRRSGSRSIDSEQSMRRHRTSSQGVHHRGVHHDGPAAGPTGKAAFCALLGNQAAGWSVQSTG